MKVYIVMQHYRAWDDGWDYVKAVYTDLNTAKVAVNDLNTSRDAKLYGYDYDWEAHVVNEETQDDR
jgi:hypothetical protein